MVGIKECVSFGNGRSGCVSSPPPPFLYILNLINIVLNQTTYSNDKSNKAYSRFGAIRID